MTELAQTIRSEVEAAVPQLRALDPDAPAAGWSRREQLGHLIDSAANNHQRFVRTLIDGRVALPPYQQDDWVRVQCYKNASWDALIALFDAYNALLAHIIASFPPQSEAAECQIGDAPPVTLAALATDYLRHLRHHLVQITTSMPL